MARECVGKAAGVLTLLVVPGKLCLQDLWWNGCWMSVCVGCQVSEFLHLKTRYSISARVVVAENVFQGYSKIISNGNSIKLTRKLH